MGVEGPFSCISTVGNKRHDEERESFASKRSYLKGICTLIGNRKIVSVPPCIREKQHPLQNLKREMGRRRCCKFARKKN